MANIVSFKHFCLIETLVLKLRLYRNSYYTHHTEEFHLFGINEKHDIHEGAKD